MGAKAKKGKSTKAKSIRSCTSMNKEFMKKCIDHIAEKTVASKANPDGQTLVVLQRGCYNMVRNAFHL